MPKLRIVKREKDLSAGMQLLGIFLACLLAVGLSMFLLWGQGKSPGKGLLVFLEGGFGSSFALEDMLIKAIPLYFCSLGVALAFKLKVWNIGAEGQYVWGAIGATLVALSGISENSWVLITLMILAAGGLGGLYALLPAYFKVRYKANEIIITLMLNYVAIYFLEYLVYGPLKDPLSFGFPMSPLFPEQALLGVIPGTRVSLALILAVIIGIVFYVFLNFTRLGFELKVCGESPRTALYSRISPARLVLLSMFLSGFLAGLAGFVEVSNVNRLQTSIVVGYGYTAIIIAWLAELSPWQIGLFSLLLAGFRVGVENLQLEMQVPAAFSLVIQGLLLIAVLVFSFFKTYKLKFKE
jgi:simple sugar transport system permease protein